MNGLILAGVVAFGVGFAVGLAGWRWGLGDGNWIEGVIVATVFGGVVAAVAVSLVDARRHHLAKSAAVEYAVEER